MHPSTKCQVKQVCFESSPEKPCRGRAVLNFLLIIMRILFIIMRNHNGRNSQDESQTLEMKRHEDTKK